MTLDSATVEPALICNVLVFDGNQVALELKVAVCRRPSRPCSGAHARRGCNATASGTPLGLRHLRLGHLRRHSGFPHAQCQLLALLDRASILVTGTLRVQNTITRECAPSYRHDSSACHTRFSPVCAASRLPAMEKKAGLRSGSRVLRRGDV